MYILEFFPQNIEYKSKSTSVTKLVQPTLSLFQVIQQRGNFGTVKENFTRTWKDYKYGFGDLRGEFWFGNDYISELSANKSVVLRIELEAHDDRQAYAEYSTFR